MYSCNTCGKIHGTGEICPEPIKRRDKETITSDDLRADEIADILEKCADQFGYKKVKVYYK